MSSWPPLEEVRVEAKRLLEHIKDTYPAGEERTGQAVAVIERLLEETAPPTKDVIRAEYDALRAKDNGCYCDCYADGYKAGARREGRQ